MRFVSFSLIGLLLLGCGPQQPSGADGEGSPGSGDEVGNTDSSGSDPSSSDSGSDSSGEATEATEETGMADACQAEPALGNYEVLLDGHAMALDYTTIDETITWTHACTVTSHVGTLASGETIVLACTDENAQPVEHTIELHALVEGAPDQAPIVVGQQVELALWLRVWFSGTVAWTLRDADQHLLLLSYNGPYLPAPSEEFAPPPEHLAPLVADVNSEVCPWVCSEDSGTFLPTDECCQRETALRIDLGQGVAEAREGSAASIPGGGHVIVETSQQLDVNTCNIADLHPSYYAFAFVGD